jgi:photosystem II stability/assembly factor-like uncharacterized protein
LSNLGEVILVRRIWVGILMALCVAGYLLVPSPPAQAGDWHAMPGRDVDYHPINYRAVDFLDASRGWVGGVTYTPPGSYGFEDTAIIGRTDSAGETWLYSTSHYAGGSSVGWNFRTATALDFVDGSRGWATLDDGTILSTTDGGARWTVRAEGSFEYRDNNWGYASLAMADATHGCAVGGWVGFIGVTYPRIAYTDNGRDWKEAGVPKLPGRSLESVHMVDTQYGWAVGSAGSDDGIPLVLVTHDGGATWIRQTNGLSADGIALRGVWFADRQHGWAVGDSGAIRVTADGGASWWSQPSGVSAALHDVCFLGSGTGFIVGDRGAILETTRAGKPWILRSSGTTATLRAVAAAGGTVWAVGDEGVILTGDVPASDPSGTGFTDIGSSVYKTAIDSLAAAGIVSGFPDGTFRPDATLNRAQFAKMIVGALGIGPNTSTVTRFTDLGTPDAQGYPHRYTQAAYDNGVTYGINAARTLFAPWDSIRRDQVVSMIVRGADRLFPGSLEDPPHGAQSFFDGIGEPHGESLRIADYNGLVSGLVGVGPGWSVTAPATRGEAAQMLYNLRLE